MENVDIEEDIAAINRIPAGKATLAGIAYSVPELSKREHQLLRRDFLELAITYITKRDTLTTEIYYLLLRRWGVIRNFVRVVMSKADLPYEGRDTTGDGLSIDWIRPTDMGSVAAPQLTWTIAQGSTGEQDWFDKPGAAGTAFPFEDDAGLIILGYINTNPSPKTTAVKWTKEGKTLAAKTLDWEHRELIEEPSPIVATPDSTLLGKVLVAVTGNDDLIPLGIKCSPAKRMRTMTTSDIYKE